VKAIELTMLLGNIVLSGAVECSNLAFGVMQDDYPGELAMNVWWELAETIHCEVDALNLLNYMERYKRVNSWHLHFTHISRD
jgi:hypothetical protein